MVAVSDCADTVAHHEIPFRKCQYYNRRGVSIWASSVGATEQRLTGLDWLVSAVHLRLKHGERAKR